MWIEVSILHSSDTWEKYGSVMQQYTGYTEFKKWFGWEATYCSNVSLKYRRWLQSDLCPSCTQECCLVVRHKKCKAVEL
jgi:hypothetical protein